MSIEIIINNVSMKIMASMAKIMSIMAANNGVK
jgi:hypothetical protein